MSTAPISQATPPHRIVSGFDGSASSEAALRWALAEAGIWGGELDVVAAWRYPAEWAEGYNDKWADDEAAMAARARVGVEDAVRRCLEGAEPPSWVRVHAVRGSAARVLIERSVDADLLVVGRGRGGPVGALLGSVSSACVHHASCPVTVMPSDSR